MDGGGSILPTEESPYTSEAKWLELSCQVAVKNDLKCIPDGVGVKEWGMK